MTAPQCGLWVALVCPNQSIERLWPPPSFQGSLPIGSLPGSLEGSGCPLNLTPRSGLTLCRVMGSHFSPWSPQSLGQSPTPKPTPCRVLPTALMAPLGNEGQGTLPAPLNLGLRGGESSCKRSMHAKTSSLDVRSSMAGLGCAVVSV